VEILRQVVKTRLNVEMAATQEMVRIALTVKPDQVFDVGGKMVDVNSLKKGMMFSAEKVTEEPSYQVALNLQFETKRVQDEYQDHPQHLEFVEKSKHLWTKVVVYDFA
jgi:pyridoxine 5'-phosphate synthase PdxJ